MKRFLIASVLFLFAAGTVTAAGWYTDEYVHVRKDFTLGVYSSTDSAYPLELDSTGRIQRGADNTSTSTVVINALSRPAVAQAYQYRLDDGAASGTATLGKMTCNGATCAAIKNTALFINAGHPSSADVTGDSRDEALKISYMNHSQSTTALEARGISLSTSNRAAGTLNHLIGIKNDVMNTGTNAVVTSLYGEQINTENAAGACTTMIGSDVEIEQAVAKCTTVYGVNVRNTGEYASTSVDAAYHVADTGSNTGFVYGLDTYGATIGTADIRMESGNTIANATANVVTVNAGMSLKIYTSDPCPTVTTEGFLFWNGTAHELCYCDNSNVDLRIKDSTTACF
jgi:hypothetical protein